MSWGSVSAPLGVSAKARFQDESGAVNDNLPSTTAVATAAAKGHLLADATLTTVSGP